MKWPDDSLTSKDLLKKREELRVQYIDCIIV